MLVLCVVPHSTTLTKSIPRCAHPLHLFLSQPGSSLSAGADSWYLFLSVLLSIGPGIEEELGNLGSLPPFNEEVPAFGTEFWSPSG